MCGVVGWLDFSRDVSRDGARHRAAINGAHRR